jgi:glycosyltransferase involved in cell wall biosynthesis
MKILQAARDIDFHMIHFSESIINDIGTDDFRYAVLNPPVMKRMHMGFKNNYEDEPWVIKAYLNTEAYELFVKWFYEADVVLFFERSLFSMAEKRVNNNKLTFFFSERWWRPPIGKFRLLHPRFIKLVAQIRRLSENSNFNYLAQGGYAAEDLRLVGKFDNRIWEWGYFTDITEHSSPANLITGNTNSEINIVWCGRLLKLKRVDTLIKAFALALKMNPKCHLTIIGDGPEKEKLQKLAKRLLPGQSITFISLQSNSVVREIMHRSDIFVLPSNGYEGWGAVLNEAMSEGCAVVASKESGGGKALISDMENGMLFNAGDYKQLADKLIILINDKELLNKLKTGAKETMNHLWSPEIASKRFLKVSEAILAGTGLPNFESGPMKRYIHNKSSGF